MKGQWGDYVEKYFLFEKPFVANDVIVLPISVVKLENVIMHKVAELIELSSIQKNACLRFSWGFLHSICD